MESQTPSLLQTGIMSSSEEIDTSDGYDLIQECEGETFTQEDEEMGMVNEHSFEHLEHGDWEGMVLSSATSMGGEPAAEFDLSVLTLQDGANTLMVVSMGEGDDYLEETADLQLEKYEAGV